MKAPIKFPVRVGPRNTLLDAGGNVLHIQDVVDAANDLIERNDKLEEALTDKMGEHTKLKRFLVEAKEQGHSIEIEMQSPFQCFLADMVAGFFCDSGGINFVTMTLYSDHPEHRGKYEVTIAKNDAELTPAERIAQMEARQRQLQDLLTHFVLLCGQRMSRAEFESDEQIARAREVLRGAL